MSVAGLSLVMSADMRQAVTEIGGVSSALGGVQRAAADTETKTGTSFRGVVTSISGVATSAFSLYKSFDAIQSSQVALDRANLNVEKSTRSVGTAQDAYNAALASGDPEKIAKALTNLQIAQEALNISTDRQALAQGNVNNSMIQAALTVVPSVITMVSTLAPILMTATGATSAMGVAQGILNAVMAINPIFLVVMAIAALVAILVIAYQNCEPFRNAINGIGSAIRDFVMPIWDRFLGVINTVWGAIRGFWDWINGVWSGITGFFGTLFGGGQQASSPASPTVNYSGVPTEPGYQSAFDNPVMFTRPARVSVHPGEVLGGERALGLGGGLRNMTVNQYFGDVHRDVDLDAAAAALRRRVFNGYELR